MPKEGLEREAHVAETKASTKASSAPKPAAPTRKPLWQRLGVGGRRVSLSPAAQVIAAVQPTLPKTDPLRQARLQTHLFLGQMPPFPLPHDPSDPRPSKSKAVMAPAPQNANPDAQTSAQASGQTGQQAPERQNNLPPQQSQAEVERAAAPDLAALRAEKQARQARAQTSEAGLGKRRAAELRAERTAARSTPNRPLSTPKRARAGSRQAQTAANRTPARRALNPEGRVLSPRPASRKDRNRFLSALLMLVMFLTFGGLLALAWYGYAWYQDQRTGQGDLIVINTPDAGPDANTIAIPPAADASEGAPIALPDPIPASDAALGSGSESSQPSASNIDAPASDDLVSAAALEAGRYEDAVLILERNLSTAGMLGSAFVDGVYTDETRLALLDYALFFTLDSLAAEVETSGLEPSREMIEAWSSQI